MSKAIITIEDNEDGTIRCHVEFDPPVKGKTKMLELPDSYRMAMVALEAIKDEGEE